MGIIFCARNKKPQQKEEINGRHDGAKTSRLHVVMPLSPFPKLLLLQTFILSNLMRLCLISMFRFEGLPSLKLILTSSYFIAMILNVTQSFCPVVCLGYAGYDEILSYDRTLKLLTVYFDVFPYPKRTPCKRH